MVGVYGKAGPETRAWVQAVHSGADLRKQEGEDDTEKDKEIPKGALLSR